MRCNGGRLLRPPSSVIWHGVGDFVVRVNRCAARYVRPERALRSQRQVTLGYSIKNRIRIKPMLSSSLDLSKGAEWSGGASVCWARNLGKFLAGQDFADGHLSQLALYSSLSCYLCSCYHPLNAFFLDGVCSFRRNSVLDDNGKIKCCPGFSINFLNFSQGNGAISSNNPIPARHDRSRHPSSKY